MLEATAAATAACTVQQQQPPTCPRIARGTNSAGLAQELAFSTLARIDAFHCRISSSRRRLLVLRSSGSGVRGRMPPAMALYSGAFDQLHGLTALLVTPLPDLLPM